MTHLREMPAADAAAHPDLTAELLKEAEYFATNAHRMRYPEFREKGFFVGSGVVEAGCKSVIGSRLKRFGMCRTVSGANAIIAPRCSRFNGRFEDYWEHDRAARSSRAFHFCVAPVYTGLRRGESQ